MSKIIYTKVDEAPFLATYSLLPIIKRFLKSANIDIEIKDISLAGRILAQFPHCLSENQRVNDDLSLLGELTQEPSTNIIKLPNISASIPQLKQAIEELRFQGYAVPLYEEEKEAYASILGSAVNPVLREGNSDRRSCDAVKQFAQRHPHTMGEWKSTSQTDVYHMTEKDFYETERSTIVSQDDVLSIVFIDEDRNETILKENIVVQEGEIVDISYMSSTALQRFYDDAYDEIKQKDLLLSLHLKATMMKVSDPILFGFAIKRYLKPFIDKHRIVLDELGINFNNGLNELYRKIETLSHDKRLILENDLKAVFEEQPNIAMVDSTKGITNFHVPSDVIIDASMPAMIRSGGKMYNQHGELEDTIALIPDRSYATVFKAVIEECKKNGALDVTTIGTVSNVGLMAKKAQEYGSHDKTFQMEQNGTVEVRNQNRELVFSMTIQKEDIVRMCQTKDDAIEDWVKLAINRCKLTQDKAIFWLDPNRGHDKALMTKVQFYLQKYNSEHLDIDILAPVDAVNLTLKRMRKGLNTISVTGNVLRDYNTDLFPILELGTSAKMLSIVPLMKGGGLFETGAGGSAPRHVQQFIQENHLRWDSLGEFMALGASLEYLAQSQNNRHATILANSLDWAIAQLLENNNSPSKNSGELDTRGSHFYLSLYWSQALSQQQDDLQLKEEYTHLYNQLKQSENSILKELNSVQGKPVDLNGYYHPKENSLTRIMRPSNRFNTILDS